MDDFSHDQLAGTENPRNLESGERAPSSMPERMKRHALRTGWVVGIIGLALTLVGTQQLASGGHADMRARMIHSAGLFLLLGAFLLALLSFRIPWFAKVLQAWQSRLGNAASGRGNATSGTRSVADRSWSFWMVTFGCAVLVWLRAIVLVLVLPDALAGLYLATGTMLLAVVSLVLIVGGTRTQRAFGAGALLPLLLTILHLWFYGLGMLDPSGLRGRLLGRHWRVMVAQMEAMVKLLGAVSSNLWLFILATWLMAFALGAAACGLCLLLGQVNDARS